MTLPSVLIALLACGALLSAHASAQSASPPPAPPTAGAPELTITAPPPAPPAAGAPEPTITAPPPPPVEPAPLVTEPPPATAAPAAPPVVTQRSAPTFTPERLLQDVKITDILIALFAFLVAIFTWRVGSPASGLRGAAQRQAEESRRVLEAGETAAEAARRSAESAEQTLGVLRDTAERQLRAYVTVKQFVQTPAGDERQEGSGWLLQVVWQNTGATPTKGFRYWAMLREFDGAIADDFEFTPAGIKDYAGGELGSSLTVSSPPLFISQQQIAKIQDGSRKMLLLGQADYHDMMRDVKRETRFCVELVLVNDPAGASGSPFSFSYHPRYNTIT